jgi:DNA-binding MarR family transcriptional regulator
VGTSDTNSRESTRITLGLLEAVESGRARTQRGLAADLDIALGLVNVYLKRCVKKGLVKVSQAPARRFAYYLTPKGFAEKSRLTAEFLSWSLTFFRQAKDACGHVLDDASARGWQRVALAGDGDLADIARICATDRGIEIAGIVDPSAAGDGRAGGARSGGARTGGARTGIAVVPSFDAIDGRIDGVVITDLLGRIELRRAAEHAVGPGRVLAPSVVPVPVQATAATCETIRAEEASR